MFVLQYFTEFEMATPTLKVSFESYMDALKDLNAYAVTRVWEKKNATIRVVISLEDRVVFRCEF